MGLSTVKILVRHVSPNVIGPMIVVAGMNIPAAIAVEADQRGADRRSGLRAG